MIQSLLHVVHVDFKTTNHPCFLLTNKDPSFLPSLGPSYGGKGHRNWWELFTIEISEVLQSFL